MLQLNMNMSSFEPNYKQILKDLILCVPKYLSNDDRNIDRLHRVWHKGIPKITHPYSSGRLSPCWIRCQIRLNYTYYTTIKDKLSIESMVNIERLNQTAIDISIYPLFVLNHDLPIDVTMIIIVLAYWDYCLD